MTQKLGMTLLPACPGSVSRSSNVDPLPWPSAGRLFELFGETTGSPLGLIVSAGLFDDENGDPSEVGVAGHSVSTTSGSATFSNFVRIDDFSASTALRGPGHFLVRPIPEPSTALLLGSGLLGLAIRGRRRKA